MSKDGLGVIVEAKQEYTKQLLNVLGNHVYDFFIVLHQNITSETKDRKNVLLEFQNQIAEIPKWNSVLINEQVENVTGKCEFFDDLLAAIFVSNVKILSSVKMNDTVQKIKIKMPSNDAFIHKVFSTSAKSIHSNPMLFSMKKFDKTNHMARDDVMDLIFDNIHNTIRDLLPLQNILQMYISSSMNDEEENEDEIKSPFNDDDENNDNPADDDDENDDDDDDEPTNEGEVPSTEESPEKPEGESPAEELHVDDLRSDSPPASPPASPRSGDTKKIGFFENPNKPKIETKSKQDASFFSDAED